MKLAFCVEDDTDAQAFALLIERLTGTPVEHDTYPWRRNGWGSALKNAPKVARRAAQDGLDGALFAIDNDGAPPHDPLTHATDPAAGCRFCELRQAAKVEEPMRWHRVGDPLRYFFAVPVQALESWLLAARGEPVPDTLGRDAAGRRELKRRLYGVPDPDSRLMVGVARKAIATLDPAMLAKHSASFRDFAAQVAAP